MVRRWFDEKLTTQAHHPSSPPKLTTQAHHPSSPPKLTTQAHQPNSPTKLTNLAQHRFPLIFVLDFVNYRLAAVIEAYSFR
jgi:hypothetical protein